MARLPEVKSIPRTEDTARFIITLLLWALVTEIITILMLLEVPPANREILVALAGTIVGALVASANFYNKSGIDNDRQKDDTIHKLSATAADIQAKLPANEPDIPVAPGETKTIAGVE